MKPDPGIHPAQRAVHPYEQGITWREWQARDITQQFRAMAGAKLDAWLKTVPGNKRAINRPFVSKRQQYGTNQPSAFRVNDSATEFAADPLNSD